MEIKVIKEHMQKVSKWSGGETRELYIYPENSSYSNRDFLFRISSATVELEKSEFTHLEGVYRFITTLDNELILSHDGGEEFVLKPFEVHEFSGEIKTESMGKVRDFNLMLKDNCIGTMKTFSLKDELTICKEGNMQFIYAPFSDVELQIGDKVIRVEEGDGIIINSFEEDDENIYFKNPSKSEINIIYCQII